jgi:hypothetical protein
MARYIAAATLILLIILVLFRAFQLKKLEQQSQTFPIIRGLTFRWVSLTCFKVVEFDHFNEHDCKGPALLR